MQHNDNFVVSQACVGGEVYNYSNFFCSASSFSEQCNLHRNFIIPLRCLFVHAK